MLGLLTNFAVLLFAFGALAKLAPCNRGQPAFLGRDLADNLLYCILGALLAAFLWGDLATLYIRGGAALLAPRDAKAITAAILNGYGPAARLPLAAQVLAVLVAMDFVQYWLHRAYHSRWLWPFHAIHHSAEDLDWSATFRIHPLNFAVYSAGALALVRVAGFSPLAFVLIGPFNLVIGALVHANLDWDWGPLRYVIASPVYHRWHHSKDPQVHDKNFAPTFPVWDVIFRTCHLPRGERPEGYGAEGVPTNFLAQLIYPFVAIAEQLGLARKPRSAKPGPRQAAA